MNDLPYIASFIDLTSLNDNDTEQSIDNLVQLANDHSTNFPVAAVCTYAKFLQSFSKLNPTIHSAVVGPEFPSGKIDVQERNRLYTELNTSNVMEVDIVMDPFLALSGNWDEYRAILHKSRELLNDKILKVIIETGVLRNQEVIAQATLECARAGADFVKTSTGKTEVGYTKEAFDTMCKIVRFHYETENVKTGIKISGGVRTIEQAIEALETLESHLGVEWLSNKYFRIGASNLYNAILNG